MPSAILLRDAGAVALLLGEGEVAREMLGQSATEFLKMRHPLGMQLAFLSCQENPPEREKAARSIWQRFNKRFRQSTSVRRTGEFPIRPDNLMRMYEGLVGEEFGGALAEISDSVRNELDQMSSAPMGATGIPVGRFLSCIDLLVEVEKGYTKGHLEDPLISLLMRREDAIEVARRDTYHWRQFQRPAELIDFDFVFLALLTHVRHGSFGRLIPFFQDRDQISSLPLTAARLLIGDSR